jgi:predicted RNase H-like HicB family nuclease
MKRYTIIVEKAQDTYSAYVPDLPGCITTGKSAEEAKFNMQEAISLHLNTMKELGIPIPEPSLQADVFAEDSDAYMIEVSD